MKATSHSSPKVTASLDPDEAGRLRLALVETVTGATCSLQQIDAMASAMLAYLASPDAYRHGPEKLAVLLEGIQCQAQTALNAIDWEAERAGVKEVRDEGKIARAEAWKSGTRFSSSVAKTGGAA